MSNYMQALRRLEQGEERATPLARDTLRRPEPDGTDPRSAASPARIAPPSAADTAARGAAGGLCAALLDRLRERAARGEPARTLVFAPVTPGRAARTVVDGLIARGRELALHIAAAELTRANGQPLLAERGGGRRPLDLDGLARASAVAGWIAQLGDAPLVLIEAPAVSVSADGLLFAAACDGLVLVAETGVTPRAALRDAAARAQAAGCRPLGVVTVGRRA
jgi:hypothetical protein